MILQPQIAAAEAAKDEIKGNVRYPYMCSLGYDVDNQAVFVQCHALKRILKNNPLDRTRRFTADPEQNKKIQ